MDPQLLQRIVAELRTNLTGRYLGKIFQLSPVSFAFDFGLRGEFLFVSVDPASPRLYLIQRRGRDLQKQSVSLSLFGQKLQENLGGLPVISIEKAPLDRIVRFGFEAKTFVAQLTGRTADLFLLSEDDQIEAVLRTRIEGTYKPPPAPLPPPPPSIGEGSSPNDLPPATASPSAFADAHFSSLDQSRAFDAHANSVRSQIQKLIRQKTRLKSNLERDLADHGDPDQHKRIGDLLLANVSTAKRDGNRATITDYYAEGAPQITIEVDEHKSLQDEAAERFRQYGKAKRAREEIAGRMVEIDREIAQLNGRLDRILKIISEKDEAALESFAEKKSSPRRSAKQAKEVRIPGVRRYLSTDGYEVLVGRAARDNDHLTFKIAHPNDMWLHAGDYPGSHVVIRNATRKEIPHRTIVEAAQLAARFSQASDDSKVVIHYTPRKFLSKPKGAAPGLVRLSRFKSLTVEPKESIERIPS